MGGYAPLISTETGRSSHWKATNEAAHVISSNVTTKFRDAFETYDPNDGKYSQSIQAGDYAYVDGNAASASYLVFSKSPLNAGTESYIESSLTLDMPIEVAVGLSMSQRTLGQDFSVEIVSTDSSLISQADVAISSISQTTTTLTVTTATNHGISVGKAIGIEGVNDSRFNYNSLVVASVPAPNQFTATAGPGGTIASVTAGPFTTGYVYHRPRLGGANDGLSMIFENATATNASFYTRSEAGDALPSGTIAGSHSVAIGTTASVQLVNSAYQYAFAPTTEYRFILQADRVQVQDQAVDVLSGSTSRLLRTSVVPNPNKKYKLRFRAANADSYPVPVAQVVSAVKTGTTTATVTFDRPHGLTTADLIVAYGARDATNFPNLATATAVASVVDATTITVVWGGAVTATTYGGFVARVQGGNLLSALGAVAQSAQSATLSTLTDGTRQLVLVGSANWAAPATIIGDTLELVGCRDIATGASLGIDGAWKIANVGTTNLTLVLPFANSMTLPADFATINCGGGLIKRTELRVSYMRAFDFARERVEWTQRPITDISASIPAYITNASIPITYTQGALVAGTAIIGDVGVTYRANNTGAASGTHIVSAATTNPTLVKNAAGRVLGWIFGNNTASFRYVKLHNQATAPTAGTGVVRTIALPPNSTVTYTIEGGIGFATGIGLTIVTGVADADNTAVGLNEVVGDIFFA
jgi:hypothetical protein